MATRYSRQTIVAEVLKRIKDSFVLMPRIKVGHLHTNSIGHLANETDIYLSSSECNRKNLVFWIPGDYISNEYLYEVISKKLKIGHNRMLKIFYRIATKVKFLSKFLIANEDCSPRSRYILNNSKAKIVLPDCDLETGKKFLRDYGWSEGQEIVVFCIRDNLYQLTRDPQSKVQNFRNSSVEDFLPAVKFLCSEDFFVLRMGKVAEKQFPIESSNFLDYAFNAQKSDLLDIVLMALSDYIISTGTGLDQVGEMFRKPVLRINYLPIGDTMTRNRNHSVLPKLFKDSRTNTRLYLDEIVRRGLFFANTDDQYAKAQVKVFSNPHSSILEEIKYFVGKSEREIDYSSSLQKTFSKYMREESGFKEEDAPLLSPLWLH